jgi:hypothetical protein
VTIATGDFEITEGGKQTLRVDVQRNRFFFTDIKLTSSNETIVRVSGSREVTAVAPGVAIITAMAVDNPSKSDSIRVVVNPREVFFNTTTATAERGVRGDRGNGYLRFRFEGHTSIEGKGLTFEFVDLPDGISVQERSRGVDIYTNDYIISFYLKASADVEIGEYDINFNLTFDGRSYQRSLRLTVKRLTPTLIGDSTFGLSGRYVNYPSITMGFTLHAEETIENIRVVASCREDGFESLTTAFVGTISSISPGRKVSLHMPYASGFPYFTDRGIRCSFDASSPGRLIYFE